MSKKILVILRSDPRQSHRPCEGIRIALGLVSGGHQVEVIFSEHSQLLLMEGADEMPEGDMARQFLDTLKEFISCFLIDRAGRPQDELREFIYKTRSLSRKALASKVASSDCLFTF